jgi:hypothetical protein
MYVVVHIGLFHGIGVGLFTEYRKINAEQQLLLPYGISTP